MVEEYDALNERQRAQAEDLVELVVEYGKFDQSAGADGSHYASASNNPFKASGLVCQNCVFWDEANGCVIVAGDIEADAICKLWIIPEPVIVEAEAQSRAMLELKQRKLNLIR